MGFLAPVRNLQWAAMAWIAVSFMGCPEVAPPEAGAKAPARPAGGFSVPGGIVQPGGSGGPEGVVDGVAQQPVPVPPEPSPQPTPPSPCVDGMALTAEGEVANEPVVVTASTSAVDPCAPVASPVALAAPAPAPALAPAPQIVESTPPPEPTPGGPVYTYDDDPSLFLTSSPIDWYTQRVWARRFFHHGNEIAPLFKDDESGAEALPAPAPRRFHGAAARRIVKLFLTNVNEQIQGGNVDANGFLARLFSSWFGGYSVQQALIKIETVEAQRDDGTWILVKDYGVEGRLLDLIALHDGGAAALDGFEVAPGTYQKMRLNLLDDARIVVKEGTNAPVNKPLEIVGNDVIQLHTAFTVATSGITTVRASFDVKKSISRTVFFSRYKLHPKLTVLAIETSSPSSKIISAANGGVIEILGEIAVVIPAGALSADTAITVRPLYQLAPHATNQLVVLGQEYAIEPAGLELNLPASIEMPYDARHAAALAIDASSLGLYVAGSASTVWSEAIGNTIVAGEQLLRANILSLGRIGVGAKPETWDAGEAQACIGYGAGVAIQPASLGIDLGNFQKSCARQAACFQSGERTYGKPGTQCLDEFHADLVNQCEALCESGFGKRCEALSAEDKALALAVDVVSPLYANCRVVIDRMYDAKVAQIGTEYPAPAARTCSDYDGLGVSCDAPTCELAVDREMIPKDTATDLSFTLSYAGSVQLIAFDGNDVLARTGIPTVVDDELAILDQGRSLSAEKVFSATVKGPGDELGQCSVTVGVITPPDPCTIVVTPSTFAPGVNPSLFMTVLPGWNTAYLDTRTQGTLTQVGLSAPDLAGNRYFTTTVRTAVSRTFTGRVIETATGADFFCHAAVTVQ